MSKKSGIVYDKTEAALKAKVIEAGVKVIELPPADLATWKAEGRKDLSRLGKGNGFQGTSGRRGSKGSPKFARYGLDVRYSG